MNIGIDVDGILTDLEKYQKRNAKKYFKGINKYDSTKYRIYEAVGCTKQEERKFWMRYIWWYSLFINPRKEAVEAIEWLRQNNHSIHIITGRVYVTESNFKGELFRRMLTHWLKKNRIKYKSIDWCSDKFSARDKADACKQRQIDIMVEDKEDNIIAVSKLCDVVCIRTGYNTQCEGSRIFKANDWKEVLCTVKRLISESENKKDGDTCR